ncbi:MAG: hypothetical protein CM15mP70_12780 [Pelagibacteraceae bacterium]|nr:MAG: hypothetical protein CM15mP70_12780 [Pelagibacteraceae bacterium]
MWPTWFEKLPINEDSLPEILIPGQVMGTLNNKDLLDLGFSRDLEIVAGTTDSIAAFLATGASQIGEAVTSIGTTLVVKAISQKPIFNKEFGIYSHRLGNRWLAGEHLMLEEKLLRNYLEIKLNYYLKI